MNDKHPIKKWQVFFACSLISISLASVFMLQPILRLLSIDFGIEQNSADSAFVSVSLAYAIAFLMLGPLADQFNRLHLSLVSTLLLAIAIFIATFSHTITQLSFMMVLVGIFSAITVSAMFPLVGQLADKQDLGKYMGYCLSATILGILVGRFLLGIIGEHYGWRTGFNCIAVLVLLLSGTLQVLFRLAPNTRQTITPTKNNLLQAYRNIGVILRQPDVFTMMQSGILLFIAYIGVLTFQTHYLSGSSFQYSADLIGMMSLSGLLAVFMSPVAGALANRWGAKRVSACGLLIVAAAILLFYLANTILLFSIANALLYLGVYISQPAIFYRISRAVDASTQGTASALYLFCCLGAGSLSVYALRFVWANFQWSGVIAIALICTLFALIISINGVSNLIGYFKHKPGATS